MWWGLRDVTLHLVSQSGHLFHGAKGCTRMLPAPFHSPCPLQLCFPMQGVSSNIRMRKFCSCLTRIHLLISQECQLGKIPSNSQQDRVSGMVKHYGSLEASAICSLLWSPSFPFFLQPRKLLKNSRFPFLVSHQVQTQQTRSFLPGTLTAQICPRVCHLSFLCHL